MKFLFRILARMSNILLSWQNWADGKQAYGSHLKSGLGLITMSVDANIKLIHFWGKR